MRRTNIYLSTMQRKAIAEDAKKRGVTASEVIRDLIDEGLLRRERQRRSRRRSQPSKPKP